MALVVEGEFGNRAASDLQAAEFVDDRLDQLVQLVDWAALLTHDSSMP